MHAALVTYVALRLGVEVRPLVRERRMKDLTPIFDHTNSPPPKESPARGQPLSCRSPDGSLVEHPLAGGADLPLDLVRDPRLLAESMLHDRSVLMAPPLPLHLHLRVMTSAARTS
jgi:hypothetical protein